jgi:bacterioferritin-associated ferredoxin
MYVCICNRVNCKRMKQALQEGKLTVGELHQHFGFDFCCGKCTNCMRSMINAYLQSTTNTIVGDLTCKAT